jgi:hypothetical protein
MGLINILTGEDVKDILFLQGLRDRFYEIHGTGDERENYLFHSGSSEEILKRLNEEGIDLEKHLAEAREYDGHHLTKTPEERLGCHILYMLEWSMQMSLTSYIDGSRKRLNPNKKIRQFLEAYGLISYYFARLREMQEERHNSLPSPLAKKEKDEGEG